MNNKFNIGDRVRILPKGQSIYKVILIDDRFNIKGSLLKLIVEEVNENPFVIVGEDVGWVKARYCIKEYNNQEIEALQE